MEVTKPYKFIGFWGYERHPATDRLRGTRAQEQSAPESARPGAGPARPGVSHRSELPSRAPKPDENLIKTQ
jgi:hypothetical protein